MAYVIAEPCINVKDTACVAVCPIDCIHPMPSESGFADAPMLYIDPAHCIDCNLCLDECPVKRDLSAGRPASGVGALPRDQRGVLSQDLAV